MRGQDTPPPRRRRRGGGSPTGRDGIVALQLPTPKPTGWIRSRDFAPSAPYGRDTTTETRPPLPALSGGRRAGPRSRPHKRLSAGGCARGSRPAGPCGERRGPVLFLVGSRAGMRRANSWSRRVDGHRVGDAISAEVTRPTSGITFCEFNQDDAIQTSKER